MPYSFSFSAPPPNHHLPPARIIFQIFLLSAHISKALRFVACLNCWSCLLWVGNTPSARLFLPLRRTSAGACVNLQILFLHFPWPFLCFSLIAGWPKWAGCWSITALSPLDNSGDKELKACEEPERNGLISAGTNVWDSYWSLKVPKPSMTLIWHDFNSVTPSRYLRLEQQLIWCPKRM